MSGPEGQEAAGPLRDWFAAAAPPGVVTEAGAIEPGLRLAAYGDLPSSRAVPRRRDEFMTGRKLAHRALARLGRTAPVIGIGVQRAPVWPDGVIGSIAHSETICVVQLAHASQLRALGVDIEPERRLEAELVESISSPGDARCHALFRAAGGDPGLFGFSIKEAFFKAYYLVTGVLCDFTDVALSPAETPNTVRARLVNHALPPLLQEREVPVRFGLVTGHVTAGVWLI